MKTVIQKSKNKTRRSLIDYIAILYYLIPVSSFLNFLSASFISIVNILLSRYIIIITIITNFILLLSYYLAFCVRSFSDLIQLERIEVLLF